MSGCWTKLGRAALAALAWSWSVAAYCGLAALGCAGESAGEPSSTPDTGVAAGGAGHGPGGGGYGGAGGSELQPICNAGTKWTAGQQAFREATAEWNLQALGVEGIRLSAVDFDGDGWPDLVARHNGSAADDFSPGGQRHTWVLRNTGQGSFEDVTQSCGLRQNRTVTDPNLGRPGEVFAFADVDNDGDLDVYTGLVESPSEPQTETSELLLNQGDGSFVLGPADSAIRVESGDVPAGAAFVDYDRDGFVDLWIPQNSYGSDAQQDHLYRGDGSGRFTDQTSAAGLLTKAWSSVSDLDQGLAHSWGWSALVCDLNGDGDAELLASSYGRAPNHLWQATGPTEGYQFINRSVASGYAYDQRTDWSDNESARCYCKLHPAAADCAGVPEPQYITCEDDGDVFRWDHQWDRYAFRLGGNSGATICGDVDNDGDMDLLTTEIVHWDVGSSSDPSELLFNDGQQDVVFSRPGNENTGLLRQHDSAYWNDGDMTGAIFDFDNDGWPDVYIGSSDYQGCKGLLYHQETAGQFVAVPFADGIDHNRSHGIAVADFDRDGDLDVAVGHSHARCSGATDCYDTMQVRLFENLAGDDGNWLQLQLVGSGGTNRAAIGARVTVAAQGGPTQTQEVGGGHGHYGAQHDLTLHFGLGSACRAQVTVRWPDASLSQQSFELVAGYRYALTQGGQPQPLTAP